jgi:hypothetical protein
MYRYLHYEPQQGVNKPHYDPQQGVNKPHYEPQQGVNKPHYEPQQGVNKPHYDPQQGVNKPHYEPQQGVNKPLSNWTHTLPLWSGLRHVFLPLITTRSVLPFFTASVLWFITVIIKAHN